MTHSQGVPSPIHVTEDLRTHPWTELRPGNYREGDIFKIGRYSDPEVGGIVAQWVRLTDGSDAIVYTQLGQIQEVLHRLDLPGPTVPWARTTLFWGCFGAAWGAALAAVVVMSWWG
jgi:hypothetical protein